MPMSMRVLPAPWLSEALRRPLAERPDGLVHSIFASAVNVSVGGRLLTIVEPAAGRLPWGLTVISGADFTAFGLRPGDRVEMTPARLRFVRTGLQVDLGPARGWDPTIRKIDRPAPAERLSMAAELTPVGGLGRAADDPLRAWAAITSLRSAAGAMDGKLLDRASQTLIGRGPGLTPSGDDVLVGFNAAMAAADHPLARAAALRIAVTARGRTTDVAQSYHDAAARGAYAEHLHDVIQALVAVDGDTLEPAIARMLAWGATSGADTLLGILLASDALAAMRGAVGAIGSRHAA
ncbi:MAG TPA: DUF2877 domain-containing protein [Candidatus Limnocylindrales bacterium]